MNILLSPSHHLQTPESEGAALHGPGSGRSLEVGWTAEDATGGRHKEKSGAMAERDTPPKAGFGAYITHA